MKVGGIPGGGGGGGVTKANRGQGSNVTDIIEEYNGGVSSKSVVLGSAYSGQGTQHLTGSCWAEEPPRCSSLPQFELF